MFTSYKDKKIFEQFEGILKCYPLRKKIKKTLKMSKKIKEHNTSKKNEHKSSYTVNSKSTSLVLLPLN